MLKYINALNVQHLIALNLILALKKTVPNVLMKAANRLCNYLDMFLSVTVQATISSWQQC